MRHAQTRVLRSRRARISSDWGRFDLILESRDVLRHLGAGLTAYDERNEHLPDSMTLEVDDDGEPRPLVRERFDQDFDLGADRPVDAAHRPAVGRVEPDEFGRG